MDPSRVYYGSTGGFEKPAEVDSEAAIQATPEYQEIVKKKIESGTAKYWLLISDATDRVHRVISAVGKTKEYGLIPLIDAYRTHFPFREIVSISAELGVGCEELLGLIVRALPERPPHFPADVLTDQQETFFVAEAIREKIFRFTHQEIPYACAVRVHEITERTRPECLYVRGSIFVEHASQKGIVIGKGGRLLIRGGQEAREEAEELLQAKVFLDLWVKVWKNWRKDPRALRQFGYQV